MNQNAFNVTLYLLEKMIGGFKKGALYSIASRPFLGKSTFCMSTALIYSEQEYKVLYISNDLIQEDFEKRLHSIDNESRANNITFAPVYCLSERKLYQLLDEHPSDILIIDSFDTLFFDIDIGRLKEIAIEKDVIVWISKQLSRPHWWSKRKKPALCDLKFPNLKTRDKFISYCDAILFLHYDNEAHTQKIILAKNRYGQLTEISKSRV